MYIAHTASSNLYHFPFDYKLKLRHTIFCSLCFDFKTHSLSFSHLMTVKNWPLCLTSWRRCRWTRRIHFAVSQYLPQTAILATLALSVFLQGSCGLDQLLPARESNHWTVWPGTHPSHKCHPEQLSIHRQLNSLVLAQVPKHHPLLALHFPRAPPNGGLSWFTALWRNTKKLQKLEKAATVF